MHSGLQVSEPTAACRMKRQSLARGSSPSVFGWLQRGAGRVVVVTGNVVVVGGVTVVVTGNVVVVCGVVVVVTSTVVVVVVTASKLQSEEHPSPLTTFPSSHCSAPSTIPLPQQLAALVPVHTPA